MDLKPLSICAFVSFSSSLFYYLIRLCDGKFCAAFSSILIRLSRGRYERMLLLDSASLRPVIGEFAAAALMPRDAFWGACLRSLWLCRPMKLESIGAFPRTPK